VKPSIVIVGSLNMDFVVRVGHLPAPGETVLGSDFRTVPGGKGANQACAAGKLSVNTAVRMVGRVGFDLFADQLKASLAAVGVDVSGVVATRSQPTGVALICVDGAGQNSIVVASGANASFPPSDIEGSRALFRGARWTLFQLETPIDTVRAAIDLARSEGSKVILDPAPAQPLGRDLLEKVDILTPNETEACLLLGREPQRIHERDVAELAAAVLTLGAKAVLLKLGDSGSFYFDGERAIRDKGFAVDAVDATAAGDVFNAALAVALVEDQPLQRAMRFANAAAALSVTRPGAQASVPSRGDVDQLLAAFKDDPSLV
jgi:ribokinase